jgi:exodeoxyribonuclease V gamma subunit
MPIQHFIYNQSEEIIAPLSHALGETGEVLRPHFIIRSHSETSEWITRALALQSGIAANLKYMTPEDLMYLVYAVLVEDDSLSHIVNRESLIWLLHKALGEIETEKVKEYIDKSTMFRLGLAQKLAECLDRYQEDAPDLISAWNSNTQHSNHPDESWQMLLWQALNNQAEHRWITRPEMCLAIQDALTDPVKQEQLQALMPALHCVGPLSGSKDFWSLLNSLSQFIQVNIWTPQPWSQKDNPGLQGLAQYSFTQYHRMSALPEPIPLPQTERPPTGMLQAVQHRLIGATDSFATHYAKAEANISLQSHYTIDREVQGLYHYLVQRFDQDPNLKPSDVCVFCPDISVYASAVQAHFKQSHIDIPFTLFDRSQQYHESPYQALQALLMLDANYFTAEEILGILSYAPIRQQFGITDNLALIRRMLAAANIREGFQGDTGLETHYSSWMYGFHRLLIGSLLPPGISEPVSVNGVEFFPVDQFEGNWANEIPKLYQFVCTLHQWIQERDKSRSLQEWVVFLNEGTLDCLMDIQSYNPHRYVEMLENWMEAEGEGSTVEFTDIRWYLLQKLPGMEQGEKSGRGGVQFIHPDPHWMVPSKVVAFLGMNAAAFPRLDNPLSFDLNPEIRSVGANARDKQAFLQVVLSAREHLYLSYIGRDIHNNAKLPPSALIEELWTTMKSFTPSPSLEAFCSHHPMHPFSARYRQESDLFVLSTIVGGHDEINYYKKPDTGQPSEPPPIPFPEAGPEWERDEANRLIVPLDRLLAFLTNSAQYFYQNALGVYYSKKEDALPDQEMFVPDNLEKWKILDALLNARLRGGTILASHLKMKGELPLLNVGTLVFAGIEEDANDIIQNMNLPTDALPIQQTVCIDLILDKFRIIGAIPLWYCSNNNTWYLVFPSKTNKKAKYQLKARLLALILRAFWNTCEIHQGDSIVLVSKDECCELVPHLPLALEDFLKLLITHLLQGSIQLYPLEVQAAIDIQNWPGITIDRLKGELKSKLYPEFFYSEYSDYVRKALEHPKVDLPPGTDILFPALRQLIS